MNLVNLAFSNCSLVVILSDLCLGDPDLDLDLEETEEELREDEDELELERRFSGDLDLAFLSMSSFG